MYDHERRSLALRLPPSDVVGRKRRRWVHPDAPRPQRPAPLPSPDAAVPALDPPESLTRAEVTALLSAPARMDLRTDGGRA